MKNKINIYYDDQYSDINIEGDWEDNIKNISRHSRQVERKPKVDMGINISKRFSKARLPKTRTIETDDIVALAPKAFKKAKGVFIDESDENEFKFKEYVNSHPFKNKRGRYATIVVKRGISILLPLKVIKLLRKNYFRIDS